MEANLFKQNRISTQTSAQRNLMIKHKPKHSPSIVSVLRKPSDTEETRKTVYKDSWFDLLLINHLSKSVQAATGLSNKKSGYDSLVEAATMAKQKFSPVQQQQVIIQALHRACPEPLLAFIRLVTPPSKFAREKFAAFTVFFFTWLVGPLEVRESEFNGRREKNVVHIKKCRFLEETKCVGMCTNLCKMPTQSFLKNSMGMPFNMVPNFDDMSCDMIFGLDPPASTDDPALKQPCSKLCKAYKSHGTNFPS